MCTQKPRTEDSSDEYQSLYAERYAYSILSDSDIENGGFRDLLGSEKVREY